MSGGQPFAFRVTVYDTDGTTVLSSVQVTIRNNTTNETQVLNTDSNGVADFNLYDFTSGWINGDVITRFVRYQGYEASADFDTAANPVGGAQVSLTLAAVATFNNTRYATPQDFLDYFNLKSSATDSENGVNLQQLTKIMVMVENDIDADTNTKFDSNGGSYYTETTEYHDGNGYYDYTYFLRKGPIISITTLQTSLASEEVAVSDAVWNTLTNNDDYVFDSETSEVVVVETDYRPAKARRRLRATYTYGRASVPSDVKQLVILETAYRMWGAANLAANLFKGRPSLETNSHRWFMDYRESVLNRYRRTLILSV